MEDFIGKGTTSLFGFFGAIVILLWGVRMIRKAVETAIIPYASASSPVLKNRVYTLFVGIFGAALLQSSTALVLIVSSIAGKVTIPLQIALGFVLGADVGTSIAAQLFSFNIKSIGPVLLFLGFILQRSSKKDRGMQKLGQTFMGFGFILYGLNSINLISTQMRSSDVLSSLLSTVFTNDIVLALLIAILLTWLSHSSLAIVLMTIELVSTEVIPIDLGITLVLGANIGACLPAYIDSMGEPIEARRLTFGNVIFRISAGLACIPFLGLIYNLGYNSSLPPSRFLALAHLIFNCATAAIFIFFTKPIGKLIERVLPEKEKLSHKGVETKFLRSADITNPDLAITNLTKEVNRISDNVYIMLDQASRAIDNIEELQTIEHTEQTVDALYASVSKYLRKIFAISLDEEQSSSAMLINSYCTDLEQVGDIVSNTLAEALTNKHKKYIVVSDYYKEHITLLFTEIKDNLNLSQEVFRNQDHQDAQELLERKESLKKRIIEESIAHKQLLLKGNQDSISINAIYLDILNDIRRINAHITAIAYPVIDNSISLLH